MGEISSLQNQLETLKITSGNNAQMPLQNGTSTSATSMKHMEIVSSTLLNAEDEKKKMQQHVRDIANVKKFFTTNNLFSTKTVFAN